MKEKLSNCTSLWQRGSAAAACSTQGFTLGWSYMGASGNGALSNAVAAKSNSSLAKGGNHEQRRKASGWRVPAVMLGSVGTAAAMLYMSIKPQEPKDGSEEGASNERDTAEALVNILANVVAMVVDAERVPFTNRSRKPSTEEVPEQPPVPKEPLLFESHHMSRRGRKIGERLVAAALREDSSGCKERASGIKWKFLVLWNDDVVNAYSADDGTVYITTGLFKLAEDDAQLAGWLAHEMGHVIAGHGAEQRKVQKFKELSVTERFKSDLILALENMLLSTPRSQRFEFEADFIMLFLAAAACYEPTDVLAGFEMLQQRLEPPQVQADGAASGQQDAPKSHPPLAKRIRRMKKQLPEAYKKYNASDCAGYQEALKESARAARWFGARGA